MDQMKIIIQTERRLRWPLGVRAAIIAEAERPGLSV